MKLLKNKQMLYELMMIFLATLSVATIWNSTQYTSYIVWITWGIFFIDFIYRLYTSENKWKFIKSNPLLIIALIPLDAIFQLARFARILHMLRLKTITKYYTMPFIDFLKRQHLIAVFSVVSIIVFLSIIPLYLLEPELNEYRQALVSSVMSLLFFGQSAFQPVTTWGHIIVVLLTILGVILHGLVISTAFDLVYHSQPVQQIITKFKRKKDTDRYKSSGN